ncbi:MAG: DUF1289 domain-containing protein [Pseudomonadota bacterium]
MSDSEDVPSPCVQICCLDVNDICIGCFRTSDEIREWTLFSNEAKKEIIKLTHQRYQDKYNNE